MEFRRGIAVAINSISLFSMVGKREGGRDHGMDGERDCPIAAKTFWFHFGETVFVFRLNSHREPYIYERHVDTSGTKRARFMIKLGLVRPESVIVSGTSWKEVNRRCILILRSNFGAVNPRNVDAFASKRNKQRLNKLSSELPN